MTRKEEVQAILTGSGSKLKVHTWGPGDGMLRYRFGYGDSYHSGSGKFTALGFKEACAFAHGVYIGREDANPNRQAEEWFAGGNPE